MQKLTVKKLIEFRGKTEKAKRKFATQLKFEPNASTTSGGGDYWRRSLSAVSNGYKLNSSKPIKQKIALLENLLESELKKQTKTMYERNLQILTKYEKIDFKKWRPSLTAFLKKNKADAVLTIRGFEIEATPQHVFLFNDNETTEVGAIWFIAKKNGYKHDELGMFTELAYQYLTNCFGDNYQINPRYCMAVDVVGNIAVNYFQIQNKQISPLLKATLDEIKKMM